MPRPRHARFAIPDAAKRAGVAPEILYRDLASGIAEAERLCDVAGNLKARRMTESQIDNYRAVIAERRQAATEAACEKAAAEHRAEKQHEAALALAQARRIVQRGGR